MLAGKDTVWLEAVAEVGGHGDEMEASLVKAAVDDVVAHCEGDLSEREQVRWRVGERQGPREFIVSVLQCREICRTSEHTECPFCRNL